MVIAKQVILKIRFLKILNLGVFVLAVHAILKAEILTKLHFLGEIEFKHDFES